MKLVHHPGYDLNLGDHVFPCQKFRLIEQALTNGGWFAEGDVLRPDPATDDDLLRVHEKDWVDALANGTLTMGQIIRLEVPYSSQMARGFRLMAGGTVLAARAALEHGRAMNIGGGFHHAFPGHGEGFCAIHDVAVAIRALQASGAVRRAMVVDCDVHQGNGTAAIFAGDPTVFTISLHQLNNYPVEKPPSNIDVHLADGTGDAQYLDTLDTVLREARREFRPDMIFYIAGADPFFEDRLGGLALTIDGLRRRDELVFQTAGPVPVCITLAGGYARRVEDTVRIHCQTAIAAAQ
jgi:acetoin utilization deacetylase AcuC-like enzyme